VSIVSRELLHSLEATSQWFSSIQDNDSDDTCKKLGQGGAQIFQYMCMDAMAYSAQHEIEDPIAKSLNTKNLASKLEDVHLPIQKQIMYNHSS